LQKAKNPKLSANLTENIWFQKPKIVATECHATEREREREREREIQDSIQMKVKNQICSFQEMIVTLIRHICIFLLIKD
jgi:hypothetical protein